MNFRNVCSIHLKRPTVLLVAVIASSCSSGGGSSATSGSTSTAAAVSGNLSQQSVSSVGQTPVEKFQSSFSTTGTKVNIDCGTAGVFTGTVDPTSGSFNVSGVPLNTPCTFAFENSTSGAVKCQVNFQQTGSYDLNNNPLSTSVVAPTGNIALGAITCDSTGNITIPTGSVTGVGSSASVSNSVAFDFTGVWTIAAYTDTLPTGYQTASPSSCSGNCGPGVGQVISLIRFHGNKFTPGTGNCTPGDLVTCPTSDGSVDTSSDGYAMSIWGGNYASGIGACGGKTGFTADEARAFAHLSLDEPAPVFSSNQLTYAHYAFSTQSGFGSDSTGGGWTDPWMYNGAQSNWDIQDCQPVTIPATGSGTSQAGMACFVQEQTMVSNTPTGDGTYIWQVGLQSGGGCVDANNNPIMVSNWANIQGASCTTSASSFNSNFMTSSCSYTGSPNLGDPSTTFTCSFTGGTFKDLSNLTGSTNDNGPDFTRVYNFNAGYWPGQPGTLISQHADCAGTGSLAYSTLKTAAAGAGASAAVASKQLLARYQCFANAYWQHAQNGGGGACTRDYNFNWSTNNYANFVIGDDRSMKPQNAFITNRLFYSPDGQWGFLKDSNVQFQSLPTPGGSALCKMTQNTNMKFHKISSHQILVDYAQITAMSDTSPTCQGAVAAAIAGGGTLNPDPANLNNLYQNLQPQKMLFYVNQ